MQPSFLSIELAEKIRKLLQKKNLAPSTSQIFAIRYICQNQYLAKELQFSNDLEVETTLLALEQQF